MTKATDFPRELVLRGKCGDEYRRRVSAEVVAVVGRADAVWVRDMAPELPGETRAFVGTVA